MNKSHIPTWGGLKTQVRAKSLVAASAVDRSTRRTGPPVFQRGLDSPQRSADVVATGSRRAPGREDS